MHFDSATLFSIQTTFKITLPFSFPIYSIFLHFMMFLQLPKLTCCAFLGYIGFLKKFDFVNFDVMSMLGFGCVSGMDYRFRVVVTCFIPLFVVMISLLSYMCRSKPDENDPEHRRSALIFLFDIIDYDQNGSLDVNEFQTVLQLLGQKDTTVMHALTLMTEWNGEPTTELSRDAFLTAASNDKIAKSLGTRWVERAEQKRSRSERLGNLLWVFFLIHAPVRSLNDVVV